MGNKSAVYLAVFDDDPSAWDTTELHSTTVSAWVTDRDSGRANVFFGSRLQHHPPDVDEHRRDVH